MQLKIGTLEDYPKVITMAYSFLKESPYKEYPIDTHKIESLVVGFLTPNNERICFLATKENEPIGMIAGGVTEALFSHQKVASEVVWWIHPDHRGRGRAAIELLGAFQDWGRRVGADYVQMVSLPSLGDSRANAIYSRLGYTLKEMSFVKELN